MFRKNATGAWARVSFKPGLSRRFCRTVRGSEGQALIEFALVVPLLFLLLVNIVNFGGFLYAWIEIANAARSAADYGTISSASPGSPSSPGAPQITTLVKADTSSLPNTVSVCVNTNNGNTPIAPSGSCPFTPAQIPNDPEGTLIPSYTLLAVDISYTFTPFIPLFKFPVLGVYGTLPPTTIRRRAVMRVSN